MQIQKYRNSLDLPRSNFAEERQNVRYIERNDKNSNLKAQNSKPQLKIQNWKQD